MTFERLNPRRRIGRCDRCGTTTGQLNECFFPYSPGARTDTPGGGVFYDLCGACQAAAAAAPVQWMPKGGNGPDWASAVREVQHSTPAAEPALSIAEAR